MTSTSSEALPPLDVELTKAIAAKVSYAITEAAAASAGLRASSKTKKMVANRVKEASLPIYDVMDKYGEVVWDEALTIFDRILVYPFTVTYRKHLSSAPKDVLAAWQFHSHSLRVGELYIIQDRTSALLEFLSSVATDCGLQTKNCRSGFESRFKKTFHRHLRERHRLTHAHERPSFTSRIIDLSGTKWKGDDKEVIEQLTSILPQLLGRLQESIKASGQTPPKSLEEIETLQEAAAIREARQMLNLVGTALLCTINDPSAAAASRT